MGSANLIQCVSDQQPNCNLMFFVQPQKFMEIQVKMDAR